MNILLDYEYYLSFLSYFTENGLDEDALVTIINDHYPKLTFNILYYIKQVFISQHWPFAMKKKRNLQTSITKIYIKKMNYYGAAPPLFCKHVKIEK